MNMLAVLEMVGLCVLGVLVGWWLGRTSVGAVLAASQQRAKDMELRNTQQEVEIRGLREMEKEKVRSEEQLKAAQQSLADERTLFARVKDEMKTTFTALAADSLENANTQFLGMATDKFNAKQEAIDTLLQPVKEKLIELSTQTQELEVKREGAYTEVLAQVKNIQQTHEGLRLETNQLVQALRSPKVRGNWGEEQLTRCLEFAGMVKHCDFNTQVYVRNAEDKAQQPDVVVKLPNERIIVIDSKNLLYETFYLAINTSDELEKKALLQRHATQVRKHLDDLSSKSYWNNFRDSPDFVVCFLPSEALFSAALEQDPSLIEYGSNSDVILATPTTLIALLKAVAYGWQQMKITRNAMAIRDEADKLYKKLATAQEYFVKLGKALASSTAHYNYLVGTVVEGRGGIFTQSRKLHELGVGADEVPEVKEVEAPIRQLQSDDWELQGPSNGIALAADAAAEESQEK
jgi:DNA recombination protein RmuC